MPLYRNGVGVRWNRHWRESRLEAGHAQRITPMKNRRPTGTGKLMIDCIKIGPDALFAAVVLSPEWGSQYRQADGPGRRERSATVAPRDHGADVAATRATCEGGTEQMALL